MQKSYKDQFINRTDCMWLAGIKGQECAGSTSMFNAITAGKDALSSQDHYKKGELGIVR